MKNITSRMEAVQSPIIPIVGQLIQNYPGTISLGQGVVNYGPPPEAIAKISDFLSSPENHKYKAINGITPLLEVIATKLQTENFINLSGRAIIVTAGSNMGFINAILAITTPGDEIILLSPYYFNHEMAIMMADCQPVLVATDENYQPCLEAIKAAITPKTKAIVTISPNNPTGVVYPKSILEEINLLCRQRGIYHISDEAYEYFTYNNIPHISPGSFAESNEHTISLYTLSKAYGFASWRIGYMVIPQHLLTPIKKIQDTIVICAPVISQYAALGCLQKGKEYCHQHLQEITKVRQVVSQQLKSLENLCTISSGDGAFYFFLKIPRQINDFELVKQLISDYGVAALPGSTFGLTDGCYLRISYGALSVETAEAGITRLITGLRKILAE